MRAPELFCARNLFPLAVFFEFAESQDVSIGTSHSGLPKIVARLCWHGWHAFRRGLATNLHRLGVSDKVIQQILRHANVTTTMNTYVKTVSADAENAMKTLETKCATTVQPEKLERLRVM
jgi:integrase